MRKKVNLTKIINKNVRVWEYLLKSMNFSKNFYSIGSEYCDHHSNAEGVKTTIDLDPYKYSLLPLSLSILDGLKLNDVKELYINDFEDIVEIQIRLDKKQKTSLIPSDFISSLDDVIKKAVVEKINDDIDKSESKILDINLLVKSISLVSEKDMNPLLIIKSSYTIK